jgi:hypothetical protein
MDSIHIAPEILNSALWSKSDFATRYTANNDQIRLPPSVLDILAAGHLETAARASVDCQPLLLEGILGVCHVILAWKSLSALKDFIRRRG